MEALDEKTTINLAKQIDTESGPAVAHGIVDFAIKCSSGMAGHIASSKRKRLEEGKSFATQSPELKPAYQAVVEVRGTPTLRAIGSALDLLSRLPNVKFHCREAWNEVVKSVAIASTDGCTVLEALELTRSHSRVLGRRPAGRVISRPLLVKGLEYDHVIILHPERYTAQELYVALTRGSKSVTVISDSIVLPAMKLAARKAQS